MKPLTSNRVRISIGCRARSLAGFVLALAVLLPAARAAEPPHQVLFVGNSYFYYNDSLHNHVRRLAAAADGKMTDYKYRSITISGAQLAWHPVAHYLTPGAIGYKTPFDVVILQGNSGAALDAKKSKEFTDAVKTDDALIRASGAKTVLYMTHAYAKGHKQYSAEMVAKNDALYTGLGHEIGAQVAPVARAFELAYQRRPDIVLHQSYDHSHPSLAGTYLAACVVYQTLYGKPALGNPYDYFGRIDAGTRDFLQQVAADTMASYAKR